MQLEPHFSRSSIIITVAIVVVVVVVASCSNHDDSGLRVALIHSFIRFGCSPERSKLVHAPTRRDELNVVRATQPAERSDAPYDATGGAREPQLSPISALSVPVQNTLGDVNLVKCLEETRKNQSSVARD